MSKIYRSAQGRIVDVERLRLANEETIAVGNMKVNARGDLLGQGGQVVKTRNQVMKDYYSLNTPVSRGGRASPRATVNPEPELSVAPTDSDLVNSDLDREMFELADMEDATDQEESKSRTKKKNEL